MHKRSETDRLTQVLGVVGALTGIGGLAVAGMSWQISRNLEFEAKKAVANKVSFVEVRDGESIRITVTNRSQSDLPAARVLVMPFRLADVSGLPAAAQVTSGYLVFSPLAACSRMQVTVKSDEIIPFDLSRLGNSGEPQKINEYGSYIVFNDPEMNAWTRYSHYPLRPGNRSEANPPPDWDQRASQLSVDAKRVPSEECS